MPKLDEKMEEVRKRTDKRLQELQERADLLVKECYKELKYLVESKGFKWCETCDGTGALTRINARIWEQFGLTGWRGCEKCGGSYEEKGKGYHK